MDGKDTSNPLGHFRSHKFDAKSSENVIRRLKIASILCLIFLVVEVIGGILSSSLAVLSDAAHLFADLASFIISIIAARLAQLPPNSSSTFGFQRMEVLAALSSMSCLFVVTFYLVFEAFKRGYHIWNDTDGTLQVDGQTMSLIAGIGVIVNVCMAFILGEHHVHLPGADHGHDHGHDHDHEVHDAHDHGHNSKCHSHDNDHNVDEATSLLETPPPPCSEKNTSSVHENFQNYGSSTVNSDEHVNHSHGHGHGHDVDEEAPKQIDEHVNHSHDHGHGHDVDEEAPKQTDEHVNHSHDHGHGHDVDEEAPKQTDEHVNHSHDHGHGHDVDEEAPKDDAENHSHDHNHDQDEATSLIETCADSSASSIVETDEHANHNHNHDHGHDADREVHDHDLKSHDHDHEVHTKERNLNLHAAYVHVLADLIQSVFVLIAGLVIWYRPQYQIIDPICTILFCIIVIKSTFGIISNSVSILMNQVPSSVNWSEIYESIESIDGVSNVHNLHVWSVSHGQSALTVHADADHAEDAMRKIRIVCERHNIDNSTIQLKPTGVIDDCIMCD